SRRRHTRSDRDWSSDVCSSDLLYVVRNEDEEDAKSHAALICEGELKARAAHQVLNFGTPGSVAVAAMPGISMAKNATCMSELFRSEERRVGKSVDLGGLRMSKR